MDMECRAQVEKPRMSEILPSVLFRGGSSYTVADEKHFVADFFSGICMA